MAEAQLEKAFPVGTIRTWKGKKFIKSPDKKWRPYYEKHDTKGEKQALASLAWKINALKNGDYKGLYKLIKLNRARFKGGSSIVSELYGKITKKGIGNSKKVTSFEQKIGAEYYSKMRAKMELNCVNPNIKKIFKSFEPKLNVVDTNGGGEYDFNKDTISLYLDEDAHGDFTRAPYETLVHESGHAIDFKNGKGTIETMYSSVYKENGLTFRDVLINEVKTYIKTREKIIKADVEKNKGDLDFLYENGYITFKKYYNTKHSETSKKKVKYDISMTYCKISEELKRSRNSVCVSDIFSGVTMKKVYGRDWHSADYWRESEARLPAEAFGYMFSTSALSKEGVALIKKYIPKSFAFFERMLESLVRKI